MDFLEQWIENDYNPFILFDVNGKIISLNKEAQYLLTSTTYKSIFSLAQAYANITFGFKTTIIDLEFGSYKFFALTVGYLTEDQIGIKLYKYPTNKLPQIQEGNEAINIYTLLDLAISASSTKQKSKFIKNLDPTLPTIRIDAHSFLVLLDKIYTSYKDSIQITTSLMLKTGEFIRIENKKYPIFLIKIDGHTKDQNMQNSIEQLTQNANCSVLFTKTQTTLSFPLIQA